jgi:DNA invertase Pin-like site-specific DNA recombinase
MLDKLKVALYCRVASTDDDAIACQKNMLQAYAKEHGYSNITVYADNGVSGLDFNRPALCCLESDVAAGYIGTVIVSNVDRIGRDYLKTVDWIINLRRKGVSLISVSDGLTDESFEDLSNTVLELYHKLLTN